MNDSQLADKARAATDFGRISDFDPDALVQNVVYALCGPFS